MTCIGKNAPLGTPISINCGNRTFSSTANAGGAWGTTCGYTSLSEAQSAKISCSVANDTNNPACISNPATNACTMTSDAWVVLVQDQDNTNDGTVRYTCSTKDGKVHSLRIDCGNGQ